MSVLVYDKALRMVLSDDIDLPAEEEALSFSWQGNCAVALEELQTYFLKFYDGVIPDHMKKAPFVVREFPSGVLEINFQNSVGLSHIGPVHIQVHNRKITDETYHAMLDYVAGQYASLIFDFGDSLGEVYNRRTSTSKDVAYIEYVFLKKYLLDSSPDLDAIAHLILFAPHDQLQRERIMESIDVVKNIDASNLFEILTSPSRLAKLGSEHTLLSSGLGRAFLAKTGHGFFPTEARDERKYHSTDTNENRFVKHFLRQIQKRLQSLEAALGTFQGGYLNPDIARNLHNLSRKVDLFLSASLWKDVGEMSFLPSNSQVLQRRDGYRQLLRLYSLLQLATHPEFKIIDFENLLETKNVPTLFEYWCFFVAREIMDGIGKPLTYTQTVSGDMLKQVVTPGLCISYEGGISLSFNTTYQGSSGCTPLDNLADYTVSESYSHNLRPDIVISKNGQRLILDAKYKGQRGGFYGEESPDGMISSWREGDIDKMHAYREAIRDVWGAYILYPGNVAIVYPSHDAQSPFEGVGALPLRPTLNASPDPQHLQNVLQVINNFLSYGRNGKFTQQKSG